MTLDEIKKMSNEDVDGEIHAALDSNMPSSMSFCGSLDLCHAAEERLAEIGLMDQWLFELGVIIDLKRKKRPRRSVLHRWYMAHATARERAEAMLMAVQKGETPSNL